MKQDKIEEDIERVAQEEERKKDNDQTTFQKVLNKAVMIAISVFLLLLVVSYMFGGGYLMPVLESKIFGFSLNQDLVIVLPNDARIVMDPNVYEELVQVYLGQQKHEFKACLIGEKHGQVYYVNDLKIPEMISQSFSQVVSKGCSADTIISLHSHPRMWCRFSEQDLRTHEQFLQINPDALAAVMCDTNRFNFYEGS